MPGLRLKVEDRLQKIMSQAGIASRRDAELYITAGRITVNGQVAKLGDKADPARDTIRFDGTQIRMQAERTYVMINKPMGIVTAVTRQSQEHRRPVRDLIPLPGHLFPVGRLDADSEGLVLMTDDGDMAQKLTHPRYEHPKTYEVDLRGYMPDDKIEIWQRGIVLDDGPTQPAQVRVISRNSDTTRLNVVMREGRKRQIRRIASLLGNPVSRLTRTHIGTLSLGDLAPGQWRMLTDSEVSILQKQAKSPAHRARRRVISKPAAPATASEETTSGASKRARRKPMPPRGRRAQRTENAPRAARKVRTPRDPEKATSAGSKPRHVRSRAADSDAETSAPAERSRRSAPSSRPASDRPSGGRSSGGRPSSGHAPSGRASSSSSSSRRPSSGRPSSRTGSRPPGRSRDRR